MLGILITIFAIGLVIFVHEFGHMVVAKLSGISVFEFSIGMGPKIWAFKLQETVYTLRLLPVGGFVKLAGLDDTPLLGSVSEEVKFNHKPFFHKFFTISAGALFNIFFGFLIFFVIFSCLGIPKSTPKIHKILPNSPAFQAGLQKDDVLISVNQQKIKDVYKDFVLVVEKSSAKSLSIQYMRNHQIYSTHMIPEARLTGQKVGRVGIYFSYQFIRSSIYDAVVLGVKETYMNIKLVFISLKMLVFQQVGLKDLAGPIGIVQLASFQYQKGLIYFLNIVAMISISLGVANLLPFPVLDGGHLLFLMIEFIFGRPLSKDVLVRVNQFGAMVLIFFMVMIIANDVMNWQARNILLKKF